MKATVTERDLREWRPIFERGSANDLYRVLMRSCDGSLPGDLLGDLDDLAEIERSALSTSDPRYVPLRERCVAHLLREITG